MVLCGAGIGRAQETDEREHDALVTGLEVLARA
jgi:hypothetical protein